MGKVAITITIDNHLRQWITEQRGNKSRFVNNLLRRAYADQTEDPQYHQLGPTKIPERRMITPNGYTQMVKINRIDDMLAIGYKFYNEVVEEE
jgi:hypothetical protein